MAVIPKQSAFTIDEFEDVTLGPIACGTPRIKIKGGYGCKANPIITQSGKVIAVDIAKLGVNYSQFDAIVRINDKCGSGTGCIVDPVVGPVTVTDNEDGSISVTDGTTITELPGGKFDSGNLGYFDDPEEPMIPVVDGNGDPTPDGGTSISIVDIVVRSPGIDYLSGPDGSMGGDGRVWAEKDDTIIETPIGPGVGWFPPIPPNQTIEVKAGDTVITPANSEPITLVPSDPDEVMDPNSTNLIRPGVPTKVPVTGKITTPPLSTPTSSTSPVVDQQISNSYPVNAEGSYEVNLILEDIIIVDAGFNYTDRDELIIEPKNGAEASVELDQVGRVLETSVTNGGEGFTDIPRIYIKSETGYNVKLIPKFRIDRMKTEVSEPEVNDKVMVVIDCTSRPPVGYLNGRPYFGPYHDHKGVRMVGAKHSSTSHSTLTSRP